VFLRAPENGVSRESAKGKRRPSFRLLAKENIPIIRFIVITLVSLVGFFILIGIDWVELHVLTPYTYFVAASSRALLRLLGIKASGSGSMITSDEFTVNILNVCNGIEATAIFFATILGFPARFRSKLLGLALGYPVIYFINILRIAALFIIGFKMPRVFETVHYYYAQAFVILATVSVWLIWVSKFSLYGSKNRPKPAD